MKKLLFLTIMFLIGISMAGAKELTTIDAVKFGSDIDKAMNYPDGSIVNTNYAKGPKEFAEGIMGNLEQFESKNDGKEVGSAMCIVHVLDNGNIALTFFSDEELQKFHNETDFVLDKYYGGYDATCFQYPSKDTQTHVTTMILKRIVKKKKFSFRK